MTLFKQIALLVSLMFLLLASVILINDFKRTATFMQGQLQTSAQDMATTLGIAISNSPTDPASLEVLFNSVFDSGYYSIIELIAVDGQVIQQKSQQVEIEGIPSWFLNLIPLQAAQGSAQVMQGWSQLGQLNLILHPGYAYSGLYEALSSTLKWFVILLGAAVALLWLLLRYLLMPLKRVQEQADSIHKNQFVQQKKIPGTVELKSVVNAMNQMVAKVQSVFQDQEKTLDHYQQMLFKDKLTGIGNRRYMLDHLGQSLAEGASFHGSFGVIKLINFDQLRDKKGYQVSDELILKLCTLVAQTHVGQTPEKIARLSDDEFAFLIATDEESVVDFIKGIFEAYKTSIQQEITEIDLYPVAGVCALEANQSMGDLLAGIDYCLTQASSEGPFAIEQRVTTNLDLPQGKMQWRSWLDDILSANRLFLVGQIAIDSNQVAVQKELFIRTRNKKDQVIPASAFMPMASGLGMSIEIDKAVFRLIHENSELIQGIPLAVNLSASFFELADAQDDFESLLSSCHHQGIQLCIEASHHTLLQYPEMCSRISERIKKYGHQFGVDNLDLGQSLNLLQSAQFNYLKINANSLLEISSDSMSSAFQALKTMADTLDLQIIAVAVDSQELFDALQKQGIEVMQGNFLNEPVQLDQ